MIGLFVLALFLAALSGSLLAWLLMVPWTLLLLWGSIPGEYFGEDR